MRSLRLGRPLASLLLVGLAMPLAACGSSTAAPASDLDAGDSGGDAQVGDGGDGGDGGGDDADTGFVLPDAGECASKTLCGASGTCCAVGDECVDGACVAPCSSGVRCAAACCGASEVCLAGACAAPLGACADSFDCDAGQFCEPTLGKCLPQPTGTSGCEYKPPTLPFAPVIEWSWTTPTVKPTFDQVINAPLVADLDGDGVPEVVIVTSAHDDGFAATDPAVVRALDGKTGVEKWGATVDAYLDQHQVNPRATPALGDLDGDGKLEIVAFGRAGGLVAFNFDGSFRARSTAPDGVTPYNGSFGSATVALADLDGDGNTEIVAGGVVLDATLKLKFGAGREHAGENAAGYGAVSVVADVDGDGDQEVVTGNTAYAGPTGTVLWSNGQSDGYPAIADLDGDGAPELVVIAQGNVRVQNARTGAVLATLALPGSGRGGPPTIADFDADGKMEIASANGTRYAVFEYATSPTPTLTVKWSAPTQDGSSNVTGSSVFDFEGDGAAEVVYGDECFVRVYAGRDGAVLFEQPSSSATIHEYPVLVDVDGDGNTEFVVVSNDRNHRASVVSCPATATPRHGVFVYGDSHDKWVRTRKIWNQHAYHITNVEASGAIPAPEAESWAFNNNYRVSSQGAGVYNAPDLKVDLDASTQSCPAELLLRARVSNGGSLGVPAGVRVDFYLGAPPAAGAAPFATAKTTKALLPGASEIVTATYPVAASSTALSFTVVVDGAAATGTSIDECNEANNQTSLGGAVCPQVQ